MNNELICTICFINKPKYIRSCKCFYCEDCKTKLIEVCTCGSSGTISALNPQIMEELKCVALETKDFYRKIMEFMSEKIFAQIQSHSGFFISILEIRSHQEKQFQRYLLNKIKVLESEVENLKKRTSSCGGFENKENFSVSSLDQLKFNTPRLNKLNTNPASVSKKPFCHEGFSLFFNKK